jgi:hypothetical protein
MQITAVCSYCREYNKDPNIEINFREGVIYYMCPKCHKESKIDLKLLEKPLPKLRRM